MIIRQRSPIILRVSDQLNIMSRSLRIFSNKYMILGFCLLIGVIFRLYAISNQGMFSRDSYTYISETQDGLMHPDHLFDPQKGSTTPPLFLILMHNISRFFGSVERGGLVLNFLAGIALIGVCFFGGMLVTENVFYSGCFSFLVAVNPVLVKLSVQIQRDSCYLLCAVGAFFLFISSIKQTTLWGKIVLFFLCGALSAASMLIRFEGCEFFLLFTGSIFLIGIYQKKPWYRMLYYSLLLGIGGLCFIVLLILFSDCSWEYLRTIFMWKYHSI